MTDKCPLIKTNKINNNHKKKTSDVIGRRKKWRKQKKRENNQSNEAPIADDTRAESSPNEKPTPAFTKRRAQAINKEKREKDGKIDKSRKRGREGERGC